MITPPHNLQIEKEIIWLIANKTENLPKIASLILPSDFYSLVNKNNFILALASYKKDGIVDLNKFERLYDYLDVDMYVSELWITKLCGELRELSSKRALLKIADNIYKNNETKTPQELIESAMNSMTHVVKATAPKSNKAKDIVKDAELWWQLIKDREVIGLRCGIKEIDEAISGLQEGHMWAIGGYTNYGKTTLAIAIAANLIKNTKEPLLFCSLEMSQRQLFEKILSNLTRQSSSYNRRNTNLQNVSEAIELIRNSSLEITDEIYTIEGVGLKIQEMIINNQKPAVVFIDYIQIVQGEGKSEYERVTNAALEIQRLAKRLGVCIVVLSQVPNQSTGVGEVIGFKSSGAIAAAADITIQIVRDKAKEIKEAASGNAHEIVETALVVQKNRHGKGAYITLEFDTKAGLFIGH